MKQNINSSPVWIPQIIANPDGLGSFLACSVPGIHTNSELTKQIKLIAEKSDSLFRVADVARGVCSILYAKKSFEEALQVLNSPIMEASKQNLVIIHTSKTFH